MKKHIIGLLTALALLLTSCGGGGAYTGAARLAAGGRTRTRRSCPRRRWTPIPALWRTT